MSLNTSHANRAVLLHSGEHILLHCKNIDIELSGDELGGFCHGTKPGYVYLTSHRMILRGKRKTEIFQSLSAPYIAIADISINEESKSISGNVHAQPYGHFNGQIEFKLLFKSNELAVEFGKTLLWAFSMIVKNSGESRYILPPYTPPRVWYEAPFEVHESPSNLKKWLPTGYLFQSPSPNSVYMTDNPPPFPGITIDG